MHCVYVISDAYYYYYYYPIATVCSLRRCLGACCAIIISSVMARIIANAIRLKGENMAQQQQKRA